MFQPLHVSVTVDGWSNKLDKNKDIPHLVHVQGQSLQCSRDHSRQIPDCTARNLSMYGVPLVARLLLPDLRGLWRVDGDMLQITCNTWEIVDENWKQRHAWETPYAYMQEKQNNDIARHKHLEVSYFAAHSMSPTIRNIKTVWSTFGVIFRREIAPSLWNTTMNWTST